MLCSCGQHDATIHLTEIVGGEMFEVHLCSHCAKEKGVNFKTHFGPMPASDVFPDLDSVFGAAEKKQVLTCPNCGMTSKEFSDAGRLGCEDCYTAFAAMLSPLIKRVHRSMHHVGKKPSRISKRDQSIYDLRILQDRLRKSVEQEEFEEAAHIRDQIKKLEIKQKKSLEKPSEES